MENKYDEFSILNKMIDYLYFLINQQIINKKNSPEMAATITELYKSISKIN